MLNRIILLVLLFTSLSVAADDLLITDAWIKNLPPVVPMRAGYMSITNNGDEVLTIVSVESETFSHIEIHESVEKDGMMSMQAVGVVSIKAGETLHLKPGGLHLMMMHPLQVLSPGDQVTATLIFDDGSRRAVSMKVKK